MKKTIPIIITVAVVLAIVVIGYFGVKSIVNEPLIQIESIKILNKDENDTIELDFANGETTVTLDIEIRPLDATNQVLDFISNNEDNVTVDNQGKVTMVQEGGATITVKTKDGTNLQDIVKIRPKLSSSLFNIGYDFTTNSISGANQPGDAGAGFFLESETLVVFAHNTFMLNFGADDLEFSLPENNQIMTLDGNTFVPTKKGIVAITITQGEESKVMNVKVIDYLTEFGDGSGYKDYLYEKGASGTNFLNKDVTYEVGSKNTYNLLLDLENHKNQTIDTFEMTLKLEVKNDGEYVVVSDLSTYLDNQSTNQSKFNFKTAANTKQFRLTVSATYQPTQKRVFEFVVNDGVNVNNHAEMTTAYEDVDVSKINIHNKINIVVGNDKKYTEATDTRLNGTLVNEWARVNAEGNADHGKTGHIYYRDSTYGSIEINGNMQTINGKNIPMIRKHTKDSFLNHNVYQDGEDHIEVQSAIIRFNGGHDASLTINNLKVDGNTFNSDDVNDSGGVITITSAIKGGAFINNSNVFGGVIGVNLDNNLSENIITSTIINETYNSGISLWNSKLKITKSQLSRTGGPAVQVIDNDNATYDPSNHETTYSYDPFLWVDEYTLGNINNWVTGTEAWFRGVHFDMVVGGITGPLENALNENYQKSIIKDNENDIAIFNLKILIHTSEIEGGITDVQGHVYILDNDEQIIITKDYDYGMTNHPVITQAGGYTAGLTEGFDRDLFVKSISGVTLSPQEMAIIGASFQSETLEFATFVDLLNSQVIAYIEWFDLGS